jgi:PAS domain-containing protein
VFRCSTGEGANYVDVCRGSEDENSSETEEFADGIQAVLKGERSLYSKEYPCHAPSEQRWFLARVTRFLSNGIPRVVIEHINISDRRIAEEALRLAKSKAEAEARHIQFQYALIRAIHEASPDGILVANDAGDLHAVAAHMDDLELQFSRLRDAISGNERSLARPPLSPQSCMEDREVLWSQTAAFMVKLR